MSHRFSKLVGCLNDSGVTSENYKDILHMEQLIDYDRIVWPENMTDEEKKYFKSYLEQQDKEKTRLCVIYTPNCGCQIEHFVILDRFPMTPKIHHRCPECEKGGLLLISDPIRFHLPLTNQDFNLDDLKEIVVMRDEQAHLIQRYKDMDKFGMAPILF